MHTIGASEARNNLSSILKQVRDGGGPITIERRGKPLAALVPIETPAPLQDRRAAEDTKRTAPQMAHSLFDQTEALARLGHWRWDEIENRCSYCSQGLADLAGVTVEDYLARTASFDADVAWAHPDDRVRYRAVVSEAVRTGSAFTIEYRLVRADGRVIFVHEQSNPDIDAEGILVASHGYVQDITERKVAERALRQSEARFRDFAEAASDWFWEMGPDLRFRWISQDSQHVLGKSLEALIGKTRWEITSEDTDSEKWRAHRADLDARRPIRDFRYQIRTDTGEVVHRSVSAVPVFDDQGTFGGYRGTSMDITLQVQIEQALKQAHDEMGRRVEARTAELAASRVRLVDAIEAISEAFVLFDADERLVLCNEKYRELLSEIADLMVPGADLEDLLRAAAERGQMAHAVGNVEAWVHERLQLYRSPHEAVEQQLGSGRWMLASDHRTRDGGIVGIRSDITEQRKAGEALEASVQRLRDIAEAASDWFWELDADLRFTYVSDRYLAVAGVSPDIFYGKRWEEIYPRSAQLQADAWSAFIEAVTARKDFRDFIHDDFRQDGQRRVIRNTGKAVFAPDGTFRGYRGTSTDITKQVQVEEELRRSEEQFRDMTVNLPGIVYQFAIDAEGSMSFPYVSPAIETILGLDPAEVVSDADAWFEIVHPDDRPGLEASIREAHRTLEPWLWEGRMARRSGGIGWFRGSSISRSLEDGSVLWNGIVLDITERRVAELALRESEARFKAVVENSPSGIYLKDLDGRYLLINQRCTQWYGPTQAEAQGKTYEELYPDEAAAGMDVRDTEVLRSGEVVEWETAFMHQDGALHDTWIVKTPVFNEQGEIVGICGINTDITERKRAEAGQRASEALFKAFVEHSPTPISIKDLEGRYTLFSPAAEQYYSTPVEQAVGKTAHDLFPPHLASVIDADDQATMRSSTPLGRDEERVREYGDAALLLTKFPIQDEHGALIGIGTIGVDVTERERIRKELMHSQARLAAALLQARIAYWRFDCSLGAVTEWSKEAAEILGIAEDDLPKRLKGYLDRVHPDDRETVEQVYQSQFLTATGKRDYHLEYRFLRPDGEVIWLSEEATAECDPSGRTVSYLGTIQDITANQRAEEQLRQAQKMEAVGQLTGGVAHDFNNLLAVIQGNTEFLLDETGPENESVQAIKRAAELGAELTRRLLAFSRQQPLRPIAIDLADLVAGMSDLLTRSLGETIEIAITAQQDLWAAAADPSQVQNALLNLAINARDAMPSGGRLSIACANARLSKTDLQDRPEVAAGDYVVLSVRDAGRGMSAQVLERAFEPFFTTKAFGQGSGLGLSMVYGFARQSGGFVELASEESKGSCAKLFLPRQHGPKADPPSGSPPRVPRGHGELVLVIEDDDQVRSMAMKMLESLGYVVIGVPEAASAWSLLERDERIELVLSDIVLPGGQSGIAFARDLEARFPAIGIVFMSGYPTDVAAQDGRPGSSKILLNKPFERAQLAMALRQVLDP